MNENFVPPPLNPIPAPFNTGSAQIPMPPTAVSTATGQLEKSIAQLDSMLDILLRRIAPAMGPEIAKAPTAPGPASPPTAPTSPLVSTLRAKTETIEAITKRIAAATDRVEL